MADEETIVGTYQTHHLDITSFLHANDVNVLAILVSTPEPLDLNASWEDWNPTPNDKNMGLWREVTLSFHRAVFLQHAQVVTKLDLPTKDSAPYVAHLTVEVEVTNPSDREITGNLEAKLEGISISKTISLAPHEMKLVSFTPENYSSLTVKNPELWWPNQMGKPALHNLHLLFHKKFRMIHQTTDELTQHYGIRQVTSELTPEGSRLFKINGKPILIRGAGWSQDLFLRFDRDRVEKELQYVRDLNLNTIRFEGRFEPDYFLDLTDRYGILIMPGWPCCNTWQYPEKWPEKNFQRAYDAMRDQVYEFRSHPSVFVFLYGSDESPPERVEKLYLDALEKFHWPNPSVSSAADRRTPITGKTGVKMSGPYNYVPPGYWSEDKEFGGGWGFNTETSPGPAIPPIESLKKFIPKDHLWPMDDYWLYHAGNGTFSTLEIYNKGLERRYGAAQSAEEYAMKSQVMSYDGHRAMFESYGKNKYHSATGIIQWMLNNAWPSLIWHLYDYYLRPSGSYYGVKKANEPVHIQYSYEDGTISVVNSTYQAVSHLSAHAQVFNFDLKKVFEKTTSIDVGSDQTVSPLKVPNAKELDLGKNKTYFVKLDLRDEKSEIVSQNFYWLSTQRETYDWKKTDYHHTPVIQEGDLKDLNRLAPVKLKLVNHLNAKTRMGMIEVTNPSTHLAFSVHLKLVHRDTGEEALPVLWDDNYFSLMPGETREINLAFPQVEFGAKGLTVQVDGWNVSQF